MKSFFERMGSIRKRKKILSDLGDDRSFRENLLQAFRPYYINVEKIDGFFDQEFNGLVGYSKQQGKEIAPGLTISAKNADLLGLLVELQGEAALGFKNSSELTKDYELSSVLKFLILRKYWNDQNLLMALSGMGSDAYSRPHKLVSYTGSYHLGQEPQDVKTILTDDQFLTVSKQYQFETKYENEDHFLYLIKSPLAISIISKKFITHVGFRYLEHFSREVSETLFVGATIGTKHGLLFLDPVCIGGHGA